MTGDLISKKPKLKKMLGGGKEVNFKQDLNDMFLAEQSIVVKL